jgi:hypothetical protein
MGASKNQAAKGRQMKEILYSIVAYIVFSVVSKMIKNARGEGEQDSSLSYDEAQYEVLALRTRLQSALERIAETPQQARLPLQLLQWVYVPEVEHLYRNSLVAEEEELSPWIIDGWRQRLEGGVNALLTHWRRLSYGEPSFLWVGALLTQSMDDFVEETEQVIGAEPDLDVLRGQHLARGDLQHVYAVWADRLFADATTAVLDPDNARRVLEALKVEQHALWGEGAEPPPIVRAHVLALALESEFQVASHELWSDQQELFVTDSTGARFALPVTVVLDDIEAITGELLAFDFSAFGGRTMAQLKASFESMEAVPFTPAPPPEPKPQELTGEPQHDRIEAQSSEGRETEEPTAYQVETQAYQVETQAYQVEAQAYQVETRAYQVETQDNLAESEVNRIEQQARQLGDQAYQVDSEAYQVETRAYQRGLKRRKKGRQSRRQEIVGAMVLSQVLDIR